MSVRVVIVDDQPVIRDGFAALLDYEDDITVVGSAGDGRSAIATIEQLRPDVVLMDVRMPVLDGISATREVLGRVPGTKVVMLTTFDVDDYVYSALEAGASGFLLKDVPAADLINAVRVVHAGEAMLSPAVTKRLVERFARRASSAERAASSLTDREVEVLREMARGRSNAEIAAELYVGSETVKTHVGNILRKLGARDRVQAVIAAYEAGIVVPGSAS